MSISRWNTVLALLPTVVSAQVYIGQSVPARTMAQIILIREATLGAREGPGALPTIPTSIVRTRFGKYVVIFEERTETPMIFDSAGRFVGRLGKRVGRGPGEMPEGILAAVMDRYDSVWILSLHEQVVFSPDLEFVRRVS